MITVDGCKEITFLFFNFSTKYFKVRKSFIFVSGKDYPCKALEVINNYKSISFTSNVGDLIRTKQIHMKKLKRFRCTYNIFSFKG